VSQNISPSPQDAPVTGRVLSWDEDRIEEPEATCPQCHQQVSERFMAPVSGRKLCFCCASAWFMEDEDAE
jgi:hypothetical protein